MSAIDFASWVPSLIATGALAFVWFDIRRFKKDIRNALYAPDGVTRYIPRSECAEREGKYHDSVCNKIDEIKIIQHESNAKRESARESNESRLRSIEQSLAKISVIQTIVLNKQGLLDGVDVTDGKA
jgi:hypothetical protein